MLDKKRLETEKLDLSGRDPAAQSPKQSTLTCPECTSQRLWRDGVRRTSHGEYNGGCVETAVSDSANQLRPSALTEESLLRRMKRMLAYLVHI